jgi:hypothetical protein
VLLLCLAKPLSAQEAIWLSPGEDGTTQVHIYFFWSHNCPHCQNARTALQAIARENPWLTLHSANIVKNRDQALRYQEMAASLGRQAQSVPGFFVCGQMFVGWDDAGYTAQYLLQTASLCRNQGVGNIPKPELVFPGSIREDDYSLPLFTLIIAGLDAFNPCAFFVLLFLLSLLTNARSRRRMLLVGGTFVLISGALYFVFMAAWLNLFLLIGSITWINLAAGVLAVTIGLFSIKDFLFAMHGPSLSIPQSAKPKLFSRMRDLIAADNLPVLLTSTVLLAVVANSYELLCTAGFPMVYTRVLTLHQLGNTEYYLYLMLYNLIYVIPLLLIVTLFVVTLGGRKLAMNEGRLLKLLSGTMMFGLGMVLLLQPKWLNNLWTGVGLLALAVATALLAQCWFKIKKE